MCCGGSSCASGAEPADCAQLIGGAVRAAARHERRPRGPRRPGRRRARFDDPRDGAQPPVERPGSSMGPAANRESGCRRRFERRRRRGCGERVSPVAPDAAQVVPCANGSTVDRHRPPLAEPRGELAVVHDDDVRRFAAWFTISARVRRAAPLMRSSFSLTSSAPSTFTSMSHGPSSPRSGMFRLPQRAGRARTWARRRRGAPRERARRAPRRRGVTSTRFSQARDRAVSLGELVNAARAAARLASSMRAESLPRVAGAASSCLRVCAFCAFASRWSCSLVERAPLAVARYRRCSDRAAMTHSSSSMRPSRLARRGRRARRTRQARVTLQGVACGRSMPWPTTARSSPRGRASSGGDPSERSAAARTDPVDGA